MTIAAEVARQMRELFLGGNMAGSNMKQNLDGLTWEQATTSMSTLNSIALLTFHINYYLEGVTKALNGGPLEISDKHSYAAPPLIGAQDWHELRDRVLRNGETFANLIAGYTDEQLAGPFLDGKYGTLYRNLTGIIEHTHYHLGQIAIIRKMVVG